MKIIIKFILFLIIIVLFTWIGEWYYFRFGYGKRFNQEQNVSEVLEDEE